MLNYMLKVKNQNRKYKMGISSDLHINMTLTNKEYKGTYYNKGITEVAKDHANYLLKNRYDIYIVNGDISWKLTDLYNYINTLSKEVGDRILIRFTLGNHELSKNFSLKEYLYYKHPMYLKTNPIIIKDTLILGTSGFYDGEDVPKKFYGKFVAETNNRYFKDKNILLPQDCTDIVKKDIEQLQGIIDSCRSKHMINKVHYVMHYIPCDNFYNNIPNRQEYHSYRNLFLGSNLYKEFIDKNKIEKCFFGHNHVKQRNRKIGNCNYYSDPVLNYGDWVVYNYEPKDLKVQWENRLLTTII